MNCLCQPSFTEPPLVLGGDRCKHRTPSDAPSIGTVSPATLAGLIIFRPLHFIPTVAKCRDRQRPPCARKSKIQNGREASPDQSRQ